MRQLQTKKLLNSKANNDHHSEIGSWTVANRCYHRKVHPCIIDLVHLMLILHLQSLAGLGDKRKKTKNKDR